MRHWLSDFTLHAALAGRRPVWFWDWLSNVTYVSPYDGEPNDEIPF